jgi:hypothetical protein
MEVRLLGSDAVTAITLRRRMVKLALWTGFLVGDEAWAIWYLEAATRNWWPGKRVLVSPAWVTEYDGSMPITQPAWFALGTAY